MTGWPGKRTHWRIVSKATGKTLEQNYGRTGKLYLERIYGNMLTGDSAATAILVGERRIDRCTFA